MAGNFADNGLARSPWDIWGQSPSSPLLRVRATTLAPQDVCLLRSEYPPCAKNATLGSGR